MSTIMSDVIAGRIALLEPLARGASGSLWSAVDRRYGAVCAAKVMRQRDGAEVLRFVREQAVGSAQGLGRHPHLLPPYTWVAEDDTVVLVMPLVHGGTLADALASTVPCPLAGRAAAAPAPGRARDDARRAVGAPRRQTGEPAAGRHRGGGPAPAAGRFRDRPARERRAADGDRLRARHPRLHGPGGPRGGGHLHRAGRVGGRRLRARSARSAPAAGAPRPGAAAGTPARHPRREPRSGLPAARGAAAGDAPARSGGPPHRGTGTGPHPAALRTDGAVVARRRRQPLRGGRPPRDRRGGTGGPARWPRVPRRARPGTHERLTALSASAGSPAAAPPTALSAAPPPAAPPQPAPTAAGSPDGGPSDGGPPADGAHTTERLVHDPTRRNPAAQATAPAPRRSRATWAGVLLLVLSALCLAGAAALLWAALS